MILKYLGCAALLVAAAAVSKGYKAYVDQKILRTEEFLKLLRHIRQSVKASLTPQNLLYRGFCSEILEKDFLPAYRECGELHSAYFKTHGSVGQASHKILSDYFSAFGAGDGETEILRADEAVAALEESLLCERAEGEKNVKLFGTLAVSLAVGLIILLI